VRFFIDLQAATNPGRSTTYSLNGEFRGTVKSVNDATHPGDMGTGCGYENPFNMYGFAILIILLVGVKNQNIMKPPTCHQQVLLMIHSHIPSSEIISYLRCNVVVDQSVSDQRQDR
jgi:hypothetical protein